MIAIIVAASLVPVPVIIVPSVIVSDVLYRSVAIVSPKLFFFFFPVVPSLNVPDWRNLPIQ